MTPADRTLLADALRAETVRLGLPCVVMFTRHRPAGDTARYVTRGNRSAVAYVDAGGPYGTSRQMVDLIVDANLHAGYTFAGDATRDALNAAARSVLVAIAGREGAG